MCAPQNGSDCQEFAFKMIGVQVVWLDIKMVAWLVAFWNSGLDSGYLRVTSRNCNLLAFPMNCVICDFKRLVSNSASNHFVNSMKTPWPALGILRKCVSTTI
jgi:hypothetical protein